MKIINIGGSTGIIEHRGKRILFDPCLDDRLLYGSWFHYPPLKMGLNELGTFDYVYISHIHEDHCSAKTIAHLNKDAEIIVMDREPKIRNFVTSFLERHNFSFKKIHKVRPQEPIELIPGLTVDTIEADPEDEYSYLIDSALVLSWDGFVLYNGNDCFPGPNQFAYIKENYPNIDLALLPYSGGAGYPACYLNLSTEEKIKIRDDILNMRIDSFISTARFLKPRFSMPFADQFVIAGSRSHLDKYTARPPCPGDIAERVGAANLETELLLLNPSQSYDFDSDQKAPDDDYIYYTQKDRESYVESLENVVYDHEKLTLRNSVSLDRVLKLARSRLWSIQQKQEYFPDYRFCFDIEDEQQRYFIDFQDEHVKQVTMSDKPAEPYIRLVGSKTLFVLMMINHISWNLADGALFIDYERVPNHYDPKIYTMLNYLIV